MRVAVVGGGVIGLSVAEALARRGSEVIVLEAGECGGAASAGNAGWITPGLSNPLPAPGVMAQSIRWMLNPRSPLLVRPVPRLSYVRFLLDFWRATRPSRYGAGLAASVPFTGRAIADFEALRSRCPFEMHREGILFVSRHRSTLEGERKVLQEHRSFGYRGDFSVLDRAGALEAEPALRENVAGGILVSGECHVRPETVTRAIAAHLREKGAEIREHHPVSGITAADGAWTVLGPDGGIRADRVVVAAGARSARLLAPLGAHLPLQGAKGYSVTFSDPQVQLRRPIGLLDEKVAVSPFDGALRLAGTLELGSSPGTISNNRMEAIRAAGATNLRSWSALGAGTTWAGSRPLLPDGLPAIGGVPGRPGLHVATGHSMLGVTMAPTTAELLAPVVLEDRPSLELAAFSIGRFNNRGVDEPIL